MNQPIIDTHLHIWDLTRAEYPWLANDRSILNKTYSLPDLERERQKTNVVAGVLVQAGGNLEDTELMLEAARQNDWIKGVVAWLPLMDAKKTQQLLEKKLLPEKYFCGIRHQIHDEKNTKWLLQPAVLESLQLLAEAGIPYDIVGTTSEHLDTAINVANKIPGLKMVFDHLNQPPIVAKEKFGRWGEQMKMAAKNPQLYAKISGLGTAVGRKGEWSAEDIEPYVEFVLEHFGTDRCFFGGDWPVALLAGRYSRTWQIYESVAEKLLSARDQAKVFFTNAKLFYNLDI